MAEPVEHLVQQREMLRLLEAIEEA